MNTNDAKTYTIKEICKFLETIVKLTADRDNARSLARYYQEQLGHANPEHEWKKLPWEQ